VIADQYSCAFPSLRLCRRFLIYIRRQQYRQQALITPPYVELYQVVLILAQGLQLLIASQKFIGLEYDIENALPKFQELIVSLKYIPRSYFVVCSSLIIFSQHDSPTKEAVAARKRLLDSFAQYDKLAKKIRSLPCPTDFSNSQGRVQLAIMMRANLFLQKNMVTLQVRLFGSFPLVLFVTIFSQYPHFAQNVGQVQTLNLLEQKKRPSRRQM
jgi:rabenosyn-5